MLYVYQLDPEIAEMFRNSLRRGPTGPYLAMQPEMIQQVIDAANAQFGKLPATAQKPVILTDGDIRRYVRRLLEYTFPEISAISYDQLSPQITAYPLGMIALVQPGQGPGGSRKIGARDRRPRKRKRINVCQQTNRAEQLPVRARRRRRLPIGDPFRCLEKLLQEEQPQLLARIQDTCRALDRIVQSGSPQEKARAEDALTGYLRALELYRELVARRDQAVAEASNSVRAAHDK